MEACHSNLTNRRKTFVWAVLGEVLAAEVGHGYAFSSLWVRRTRMRNLFPMRSCLDIVFREHDVRDLVVSQAQDMVQVIVKL